LCRSLGRRPRSCVIRLRPEVISRRKALLLRARRRAEQAGARFRGGLVYVVLGLRFEGNWVP
jgi:hypothetical protein